MKKLMVAIMLVAILAVQAFANVQFDDDTVPVEILDVWIDGKPISDEIVFVDGEFVINQEVRADIERGNEIEVEVKYLAMEDAEDVVVEAEISGFEHARRNRISEISDTRDIEEGRTYWEEISLELPNEIEQGIHALRIEISDRRNDEVVLNVDLDISTPRNAMFIDDVLFSPGLTVQAGRSLLASVRVENFGRDEQDDVKVTLTIPELGVSDADYIDEIESEDADDDDEDYDDGDNERQSEELYVRLPECTEEGNYKLIVEVNYDDGYETEQQEYTLRVTENPRCTATQTTPAQSLITVGPDKQNVAAGGGEASFPVAITNTGTQAQTYSIVLSTPTGLNVRSSQNLMVIEGGETKVATVYVSAEENAQAGEQMVSLQVMSGGETIKVAQLTANVVKEDSTNNLRNAMYVGLVVLVVLLVIVGLIVGFSRLRNEDEEGNEDETYY